MSASASSPWLLWALASAACAALTAIFAKVGIRGVDSDYATLIRTAFIFLLLIPFVVFSGKWVNPQTLSPRTLVFLMLSALATGASWLCYFRALQLGNATQVAPVDKLSIVLVGVFAFVFLDERPTEREWIGLAFVSLGVVLMVLKPKVSSG